MFYEVPCKINLSVLCWVIQEATRKDPSHLGICLLFWIREENLYIDVGNDKCILFLIFKIYHLKLCES